MKMPSEKTKIFRVLVHLIPMTALLVVSLSFLVYSYLPQLEYLRLKEKNEIYSKVTFALGYGGAIHDFKNYVIRHDELYYNKSKQEFNEVKRLLNEYNSLSKLSETEKKAISDIRDTVNLYSEKLELAKQIISKKTTIENIDLKVKVNDTLAILAKRKLKQQLEVENVQLYDNLTGKSKLAFLLSIFALVFGIFSIFFLNNKLNKELDRAREISSNKDKLASLGEMSAGIAHEINNPLAIIDGNIALLSKQELPPFEIEKKYQKIKVATYRITQIVSGLAKFARSHENLKYQLFPLVDVVENCIGLYKNKLPDVPVELRWQPDPIFEGKILCDLGQLCQALINLITNAVEAALNTEEKWVEIRLLKRKKDIVEIAVIDSGRGIEEKILRSIYDPFYTTKAVGVGTGLGLSMAKGIISSHGGDLEYELIDGHTAFVILMPKVDRNLMVA